MIDEKEFLQLISSRRSDMVRDMFQISRIPAVNPRMQGSGEYKRMIWLKKWLEGAGLSVEQLEVQDDVVDEKVRLNLLVKFPGYGKVDRTLWFIAHVDTVNTGDLSMWNSDPFEPTEKEGKIYGLGCEDNTQSVVVLMHLAKIMKETGHRAKINIAFLFVSDEETGSKYGLHALVKQGIFHLNDEAIVPDGGSPRGDFIEIAEKSQVWLKFTITGKQGHAAMPDLGINACSAGMHLGVEIEDTLKREYSISDPLFNPPVSTFELTQKLSNVSSPNILPGQDIFMMDMRILPKYKVDDVMNTINRIVRHHEDKRPGLSIRVEFITRADAPSPTPADSEVVQNLITSVKATGIDAKYGGIGGATCAAILRSINIPAVVWSTLDDMCHQPNEYVVIDNMIKDAQVFASTILKY